MKDKNSFYASIYYGGLLGGAAYLDGDGFNFKCRKATADKEIRDLKIRYDDIQSVCFERKLLVPLTVIRTFSGTKYRFLIFNRKKFINIVQKKTAERLNG